MIDGRETLMRVTRRESQKKSIEELSTGENGGNRTPAIKRSEIALKTPHWRES